MAQNDIYDYNDAGEMGVRVVQASAGTQAITNSQSCYMYDENGNLAVRVIGLGGGGGGGGTGTVTSVNGVQPVDGNVEITGDNITATVGEEEASITQHLTTFAGEISAKVNIAQGADNTGKVMTVGEDGNLAPADAPSSSLPDQTGNAGKFLTTDGSNVSWKDALVNNAEDKTSSVALGDNATATNNNSVCVGVWSGSTALGGIAIGSNSYIEEEGAVQINSKPNGDRASNTEANTFKWQNNNGNFTLFDENGTIPSERIATGGTEGQVLTKTTDGVAWQSMNVYSKEETDQQIQNAIGTIETALAEV